ncbi:tetratricopeptide repeat protein [Spirillospora sp. CA-253888]
MVQSRDFYGPAPKEPGRGPMYLPHLVGGLFTGREAELARLDTAFATPESTVSGVRPVVVHGRGGIGKSTLAAHWAATRRGEGQTVWWIVADRPAAAEEGLAGLGAALLGRDATGQPLEALAEHAFGWLNGHAEWVLVLDDMRRPADAEPVLARLDGAVEGRVLITTRQDTGWESTARQIIALDVLSREQAVKLLAATVTAEHPSADLDGADELCRELGCLPLAIEQASGYLTAASRTPRAYLQTLAAYPAQAYDHHRAGDDCDRTIARIWHATLDHLNTEAPLTETVLRVLAWFAPDQIPRAVLDGLPDLLAPSDLGGRRFWTRRRHRPAQPEPADDRAVAEAVKRLASHKMITLSDDGRSINVHRLVQTVARTPTSAGASDDIDAARRHATILLDRICTRDPDEPSGWPLWRALMPHIDALADHAPPDTDTPTTSRLLGNAGSYRQRQGAPTRAITHLQRALAAALRLQGEDHPDTLDARDALANAHLAAGDVEEAIALYEQTLAVIVAMRRNDHPEALDARGNLASAYQVAGDLEQAIALYELTLADCRRVLGEDHPTTRTVHDRLRVALRERGNGGMPSTS